MSPKPSPGWTPSIRRWTYPRSGSTRSPAGRQLENRSCRMKSSAGAENVDTIGASRVDQGIGHSWPNCPMNGPSEKGSERMHLEYTLEQQELRAKIRAQLESIMTPERSAAVSRRGEGGPAIKECVRALAAANLLGVGWPKEYG